MSAASRAGVMVSLALLGAGCGLRDPYADVQSSRTTAVHAQRPGRTAKRPHDVGAATRRFLPGYLRYLYGLAPAREIESTTKRLGRVLAAQPMTRDDGASPSRPRVESLRVMAQDRRSARCRAIVSDESGVYYGIDLGLVRTRSGWRVDAVRLAGAGA